eukprot:CAMPEP_0181314060 /NCGR_PEP_ID=MMETSP1101-20121128/14600_1 /TAXON_ID=46948 /ORGANISM="Rhodomonas abbreviata, Strain Caron Lab Isolate" /LENGTH=356 /DNA_ID=CAMNT_0023421095 /DNA_START=31 /DNA_END=1101 /DNA_ORIENTATION=-
MMHIEAGRPAAGGEMLSSTKQLTVSGKASAQKAGGKVATIVDIVADVRRLSNEGCAFDVDLPTVMMPESNDAECAAEVFSNIEATACEAPVTPQERIRYSIAELFRLRTESTQVDVSSLSIDKDAVSSKIRFTSDPKQGKIAISHVQDLEVETDQIVQVYNLGDDVTWPLLNTCCTKTIGLAPLTIRMMRREKPAQALLIFRSADEAREFMKLIPAEIRLKGRRPRFELGSAVRPCTGCAKAPQMETASEEKGKVFGSDVKGKAQGRKGVVPGAVVVTEKKGRLENVPLVATAVVCEGAFSGANVSKVSPSKSKKEAALDEDEGYRPARTTRGWKKGKQTPVAGQLLQGQGLAGRV